MTILEKIDELRQQRGWSVNYLALEAMLTQSTLNNLYSRGTDPKISTLKAICQAFGITLGEFFTSIEQDKPSTVDDELINRVTALSGEQKQALLTLLRGYK